MDSALLTTFFIGLIAATLRVATPLIFATVGEVITERSGVLNLGIEGIMFLGAFAGFAVAAKTADAGIAGYLWIGLLGAIVAGGLMGLLMAFFSVTLGVNQHVAGLGITLLSVGLSLFGFRMVFGESSVLPSVDPFDQFSILGCGIDAWWCADGDWRCVPVAGTAWCILAGDHRRARLGLHCAGHLCALGSDPCDVGCAALWWRLCAAVASANHGL